MPYLHYETDEGRQKMADAMNLVGAADESSSATSSPNMLLLQAYLNGKTKIHPRRTLDQFFYHGLDTSARDRDQVVYRYCESQGQSSSAIQITVCSNPNHTGTLTDSRAPTKSIHGRSTLAVRS